MSKPYTNPMLAGNRSDHYQPTPKEIEEARRKKAEADARAAYVASPIGQAEAAWERGDTFFQLEAPLSELKGRSTDLRPGLTSRLSTTETTRYRATDILGAIEEMGWRLEHFASIFVETESNSRSKRLSSGEITRTSGYVEGIYVFRRGDQ